MYQDLRHAIDTIPMVDDHAHLGVSQAVEEMGHPMELMMPYKDVYMTPAQSSFGFPYLAGLHAEAYTKYYGFSPESLSDPARLPELAAAYEARRRELAATLDLFMEAGNVEHVICNLFLPKALEGHPGVSLIPTVDPLLYPFGSPGLLSRPQAKEYMLGFLFLLEKLKQEYGVSGDADYEEYMRFADRVLDGYKEKGCSGYKLISAYVRSLHFPKPTGDGAELYRKAKAGDAKASEGLQNLIAWKVMEKSAQNKMPVQLHTALIDGFIDYTDPLSLQNFLEDDVTYQANIVLLHAGYPLFSHAKTMAMAAKPLTQNHIYIDFSGRVLFGNHPRIIAKMLRDFLDIPSLWSKILYGSDTIIGERFVYTCARTGRDAVYYALSGMLDDGILTEPMAVQIAKDILRNNAIRLYNLPLKIL